MSLKPLFNIKLLRLCQAKIFVYQQKTLIFVQKNTSLKSIQKTFSIININIAPNLKLSLIICKQNIKFEPDIGIL